MATVTTKSGVTTIFCSKCGCTDSDHISVASNRFKGEGWVLNSPKPKNKLTHLCPKCSTVLKS